MELPPAGAKGTGLDGGVGDEGGFERTGAQLTNLQLQLWDGENGAKRKDRIEVKLQCLVCTEQVSLDDAQREIADNWHAAYHKYALVKCNRRRVEE